eukprot:TRINITY_DN10815_c0_g1_i2.p1 TRINITY_DN10815_c0_g1~~TRINITY_DN10815_c0_g1_i2.p1  ORF type:complete len:126 (-),score=11.90 TRINITY_DN10815_c0_g1_i2:371-748(-)
MLPSRIAGCAHSGWDYAGAQLRSPRELCKPCRILWHRTLPLLVAATREKHCEVTCLAPGTQCSICVWETLRGEPGDFSKPCLAYTAKGDPNAVLECALELLERKPCFSSKQQKRNLASYYEHATA